MAVIIWSLTAQCANAATQRIGLLPGTYRIPAVDGAAATIASFCYDRTRDAPNAAVALGNVVSGASLLIQVGPSTMPLQTALDRHLVEFHGLNVSPHIAAERALFNDFDEGDFRNVHLINHTDQRITLKIKPTDHLVIAKERESAPPTAYESLIGDATVVQEKLWADSDAKYTSQLSDLGFIDGDDSDIFGDFDLRPSLLRFQDAYHLPLTGQVDAQTEEVLLRAGKDAEVIRAANASRDNPYIVVSVYSLRRVDERALYYATLDGEVVYEGDSAAELRKAVVHEAHGAGASVIYIDATTFDAGHAAALRHSLMVSANDEQAAPVFVLDGSSREFAEHNLSMVGDVFDKNVIDIVTTSPEKVGGGFEASATFVHADGTSMRSRIFAKSRDLLETFLDVLDDFAAHLRVQFASISPSTNAAVRARAADAVNLAYAETARRTGMSEHEIRSRLYVQFASFQVAIRW